MSIKDTELEKRIFLFKKKKTSKTNQKTPDLVSFTDEICRFILIEEIIPTLLKLF